MKWMLSNLGRPSNGPYHQVHKNVECCFKFENNKSFYSKYKFQQSLKNNYTLS